MQRQGGPVYTTFYFVWLLLLLVIVSVSGVVLEFKAVKKFRAIKLSVSLYRFLSQKETTSKRKLKKAKIAHHEKVSEVTARGRAKGGKAQNKGPDNATSRGEGRARGTDQKKGRQA